MLDDSDFKDLDDPAVVPFPAPDPAPYFRPISSLQFKMNLRAYPDGKVDLSDVYGFYEIWTFSKIQNNKYTLKSIHGKFLRCFTDGRVDTADTAREWEQWTLISNNGADYFKSYHNGYLRAYPDGHVDCNANPALSWEKWGVLSSDLLAKDLTLEQSKRTIGSIIHFSYLRAYPEGKVDLAPVAKEWETWDLLKTYNGKYVIRSVHNQYLRCNSNGVVDTT